jgi:hypothetical protein
MKTQTIRLLDVFAIGPLMMWAGYKLSKDYKVAGPALLVTGLATIVYNGQNYLEARDA